MISLGFRQPFREFKKARGSQCSYQHYRRFSIDVLIIKTAFTVRDEGADCKKTFFLRLPKVILLDDSDHFICKY